MNNRTSMILGTIGALWGLAGVLTLLLSACFRLWPKAVDAFSHPLGWHHWTSLFIIVLGMAYAEGYKGFQKAFSPRTAARARYLRANPRLVTVILAPFFCMGYFYATKRRRITSIFLTLGIIVLIIMVSAQDMPSTTLLRLERTLSGLEAGPAERTVRGSIAVLRRSGEFKLPAPCDR